jgi:ferrous iron transport protein B
LKAYEVEFDAVGNPNSGKTSLFNALTGANQQVGNWSGVTVDKKSGHFAVGGDEYQLMDLPGIYALESRDSSIDEQIAFRYAMTHKPDLVINVIRCDCSERSQQLTLQCGSWAARAGRLTRMMWCASGRRPSRSRR